MNAQDFQEISCGAGYNQQSYVKLLEGTEKKVNNNAWDLMFTAFGFQDAGIFINESSGSSMGQNLPQTELYYANTGDFNATITLDSSITKQRFLNSEASWNFGAFNEIRNPLSPLDFGWGVYNPAMQRVEGNKVFVIKLRDGSYKKIKIETLTATDYSLKYANLDGSNEVVKSLSKTTDSYGKKFIFFSFASNSVVDVLPAGGFDLMYGRFTSLAKDPNGTIEQQYNVTGVLTGPGVQVAVAKGIDPKTVSINDYADKFGTRIDLIGHDWKTLSGISWELPQDRAYFVKTAGNQIWKIVFKDFEGAATGTAVIEKTNLTPTSTSELVGLETSLSPNPVQDELFITLDNKGVKASQLSIEIIDQTGRVILHNNISNFEGFNVLNINASDWHSGLYIVKMSNEKHESVIQKFIKI
jgi:hypothetical protein